jgi:hypothetical protein
MERDVIRFYMFIRYSKENINEVTDGILLGGCRMNCTWKSKQIREKEILSKLCGNCVGRDSTVGIAIRYGLGGPGTEFRWWRNFPNPSGPALGPIQPSFEWVPGLFRG